MQQLNFQPNIPGLRKVPAKNLLAKIKPALPIIIAVVVVSFGVFTGLILSSRSKNANTAASASSFEESLPAEQKQSFNQTFRDSAEGVIQKNDSDKYAQGAWKLIRPGGEDQTAYLTSSVIDLDAYIGKKVKVYGETFGSSQVGWLMDVGKVEAK